MTFQPGQSGNPGGRRKDRPFHDALMLVLRDTDEAPEPDAARNKLRATAFQLVSKAIGGDVAAIKEVADRIDGKVPQAQVHMGDEEGGPIEFQHSFKSGI